MLWYKFPSAVEGQLIVNAQPLVEKLIETNQVPRLPSPEYLE